MKMISETPRTALLPEKSLITPAMIPPKRAPSVVDEVMSSFWPELRAAGPRSEPIVTRAPEMTPVS